MVSGKFNLENYNENNMFWKNFDSMKNSPYMLKESLNDFRCMFVFLYKEGDFSYSDIPISIGYMASILRMNKAKVTIFSGNLGNYDKRNFSGFGLICFYPMASLIREISDYAKKIKEDNPGCKICFFNSDQHQHEMVLCNPKAIDFGISIMGEYSSIDFTLIGEAEKSLLELCSQIASNRAEFSIVPECLYRSSGKILQSTKKIEPVNFEFIPYPARDYLEKGLLGVGTNKFPVRVQSSRGCVSPCLYCAESFSNIHPDGRKVPVIKRSIQSFVDEIKMLSCNYRVVFFNIIDSSFEDVGSKGIERMAEFCAEIGKRGILASFKIHLRIDTIEKLSDEFLSKLKDAGVDVIIPGIESSLDYELKSYKKITTSSLNLKSISRFNISKKFFILLGHMMFSPIVKFDDLKKKIWFLRKLSHGWDFINVSSNVIVFKGTAYHDYIAKLGLALETDELSPVVNYRYEDERVMLVAHVVNSLKSRCPEVLNLQNLLYDSLNIISRYQNRVNSHLWENSTDFNVFRERIENILETTQEAYFQYFTRVVDLVKLGMLNDEQEHKVFTECISGAIPTLFLEVRYSIDSFLNSCNNKGLSTGKLYLKTWMSLINTQVNTSGGKVET